MALTKPDTIFRFTKKLLSTIYAQYIIEGFDNKQVIGIHHFSHHKALP